MDMSKESRSLIKEANKFFRLNEFEEAEQLYKRAGDQLGSELVSTSIWLCQKRKRQQSMATGNSLNLNLVSSDTYTAENFVKQKKQLEQTQQLLEEYYQQSQSLKLQLMQRN
jgi:hypothetical protein